jgi:Spy/CpxP family protein refolding chaperone
VEESNVKSFSSQPRQRSLVLLLALGLLLAPTLTGAREFKISRYIEPNQMSNLFTRHVRKGIIKRIGLTEAQLYRIRDAIDPHRKKLLSQMTELKDARIDLVYAVADEPFNPERVRTAHALAAAAEIELTLTVGVVIRELRPILTKEQLREMGEMMEEIREASELRFVDFSEQLAEGELLGLEAASTSPSAVETR